ncbi:hypothetical protein [Paenibacillus amylolyticus]|uniref:Uncharacterized protein n=1 Tax=Paenibacillus amylolyticus TaxID=1451 RepID=A0A124DYS1_PAEAM|nr:hypothetical protein [Paenibacillus amylolyticus]GAS85085.1 unknown protein [Paenibacillus amylolyticus]
MPETSPAKIRRLTTRISILFHTMCIVETPFIIIFKRSIQNILDKYEVNEPFSDEDTQYLKENSALNNNITYIQNKGDVSVFSVSKKFFTGNNKTLALTGYVEYDNRFGKNSWNFYMDAWDTAGIKRNIRAEVKIDCVGIS